MTPTRLRTRLLLAIALPPIAVLGASLAIVYAQVRSDRLAQIDEGLRARLAGLAALIERDEEEWEVDFVSGGAPKPALVQGLAGWAVADRDGRLLGRDGLDEGPALAFTDRADGPQASWPSNEERPFEVGGPTCEKDASGTRRVCSAAYLVESEDSPGASAPVVTVRVAASMTPLESDLFRVAMVLGASGLGLALLAVALGWFLARRITAPLAAMAQRALHVEEPPEGPLLALQGTGDEVDALAAALNDAFRRLRDAWERQRRFTADASHELRTPLSVIRAQAEIIARHPRTGPQYQAALEAIAETAGSMQATMESLLLLARVSGGAVRMKTHQVDLNELARDVALRTMPKDGPTLTLEPGGPVVVVADRTLMELAIGNLLSNAVRHTPPDGRVSVSVGAEGEQAVVRVVDSGSGISATALPHVFEPFFRADDDRAREPGGVGLGLALVLAIMDAHGGAAAVQSRPGEGASFELRIPCVA